MAAVAIAFAVGILAADLVTFAGCLLIVLSLAALGFLLLPAQHRATLVLVAAVLLAGSARYAADRSVAANDISLYASHVAAFEGRVVSDLTTSSSSTRLTLRVEKARVAGKWREAGGQVMVSLYRDHNGKVARLMYGDRARLMVRPYVPFEPSNPGQFSWKNYLARHGIYSCASVRAPHQVLVLRGNQQSKAMGLAIGAKHHLVSAIRRIHPAKEASVVSGVALGTYAYLDEETLSDFTRTGTLHVLAASGYNCFVLVMLSTPVLMLLRVPAKVRTAATIFLLTLYLLMVGPMPSLTRAAVMSALLLLAVPLRRVAVYVNLLYVAAVAVLLVSPSNLFEVGFQLSFTAVLALIYVVPVIDAIVAKSHIYSGRDAVGWNRKEGRMVAAARKTLAWLTGVLLSTAVATTAVGLMTAPIVAFYFNYISLTSLPANLAVAVLVPFVFFDGLLSPLQALMPHSSHYAGFVGTAAARAMLSCVNQLASMRYSSIAVQSPGALGIAGYYLLLYAGAGYVRSRYARK